ncbi:oxidative stress defense protein [Shewanella maritima]|uniref:oxidative stress defense protein n=1 Tax=Shewanella maritima TaxID=2520507 RepID=UPI0037363782
MTAFSINKYLKPVYALTAAVLLSTSVIATQAIAAERDFPSIETQGYSEVHAEADMAEVYVAVTIEAETAKAAKQQSDSAVADFIARLNEAGVGSKHINSANINLRPQYHYEKNKPRQLIGYQASRQVTVTVVELAQLNDILDSALAQGINNINRIELKSSKEAEIKQQARALAISNAKDKANSLAQGFDTKVKGVWLVRYQDYTVKGVQYQARAIEAMADGVSQSYQQDEIVITDRVEVVFRLAE